MSKKTVAVLFGGVSSEYEVSLRSAASVLRNIPAEKYDAVMLGITKEGRWLLYSGSIDRIEDDTWQQGKVYPAFISPDRSTPGILCCTPDGLLETAVDAVFPVMHGENCEDGAMQGLLTVAGLPFVGCGVLSSAACMDKHFTHILLEQAGVPMTPWKLLVREDLPAHQSILKTLEQSLGYPMFVKPANTGSSVGVSKVSEAAQFLPALEEAFRFDRKVLVEKAIIGAEVECAVLGNFTDATASVIGEIVPTHDFYDYEGKYLDDSTDLYIPARIPVAQSDLLRQTAKQAFFTMGCSGLARVDFFACANGSIMLNEINTIPGFTSISMYPKLFEASGIPYSELIDRLIMLAIGEQ